MNEKEIFEVVKYFKSIYTIINNKTESLRFVGRKFFYETNTHFLMYGELAAQNDNPFLTWADGKTFEVKIKDIDSLRSSLKKNMVSLDSSGDFSLKYKDRDENEVEFLCSESDIRESEKSLMEKVEAIEGMLKKSGTLAYSDFFNKEIVELYLQENGEISESRTSDKIVEIPFKRIQSVIKDSDISVDFSDKDEEGKRFVRISCSNDLLSLSQIFATI